MRGALLARRFSARKFSFPSQHAGASISARLAITRPGCAGLARFNSSQAERTGPDGPRAEEGLLARQPRWPGGWHDMVQYHLFFEDFFVQARVFRTPSLEEHSLWIFDHSEGKVVELVNSSEPLVQGAGEWLQVTGPKLSIQDGPGGGSIKLSGEGGQIELEAKFQNQHVFSWLPAGITAQDEPVIHRPDMDVILTYKGITRKGRGYSKRYFGHYGPQWGYRFIQSSWLGGEKFLWTADATFRLGSGEAKYNYFKLLDGKTGELVQADSKDTYQQDCSGYADIDGEKYEATVTPLGEWMHDYKSKCGETNSRMQLRYCKIRLTSSKGKLLEGFALNERCFGVLG